MALNNLQKQQIIRRMADIYSSGGNKRKDIIATTMAKYQIPIEETAAVQYQYTLAKRTVDAAAIMRRTHNRTPLPSEIPSVAGERARVGMYRMEILVSYTDPLTGRVSVTRDYLYTADPMSLDRVRNNVDANRDKYIHDISSSDKSFSGDTGGALRTIVLNVGRVYVAD